MFSMSISRVQENREGLKLWMGQINFWPALFVQSVNTVRQTHATPATFVKFTVFTPWRPMREWRYSFAQGYTNCGRMNLVRRCLEIWGGIKSVLPWPRPFLTSKLEPDERLRHAHVALPTGCRICCQANVSFCEINSYKRVSCVKCEVGLYLTTYQLKLSTVWDVKREIVCMSQCCSLLYGLKHLKKCTQFKFLPGLLPKE